VARQPDPDLEERILKAAQALWKRGGEKALTMRAVARAAHTNTPAVYRRFKDRHELVRGLLLRTVARIRKGFEAGTTLEEMIEAYIDLALEDPHEYELFYAHAREFTPRKLPGKRQPIRESRPNFALLEQRLVKRLGGSLQDQTQLALALWALVHGTTTMLLQRSIPHGHENALRSACRTAVQAMLNNASRFCEEKERSGA